MSGNVNDACWKSTLELQCQSEESESLTSTAGEDGNSNAISVGSFMRNLFEKQLYTDVDFFFKKETISAHRVVLSAKCRFFEKLLFGDRKMETTGGQMKVEINNVPFQVFKSIVKYFYTDHIDFSDDSTVLDIYATALSFKIQPLIDDCELYMEDLEINEDNACCILQLSNIKNAEPLKIRCIDYIKTNTLKVISSPDFEKCSYSTVREICNLQDLNLQSEVETLDALMRWINVQPEHTQEELKKALLKCIRFLSFTPKQFREAAKRYSKLVTSGEALDILMYLNDRTSKNVKELPNWVNRGHRSFSRVCQSDCQNVEERIIIPLKPAGGEHEMTELTSVLQMKCISGFHQINAVKFLLQDISSEGNMIPVLVIKTLVAPRGHSICFSKTIDSKETVLKFHRGIFVDKGQIFVLNVEIKACQSCKFLQFDASQDNIENKHFQCSVANKPKLGRFFFIGEVEYGPRIPYFQRRVRHRGNRKRSVWKSGSVC